MLDGIYLEIGDLRFKCVVCLIPLINLGWDDNVRSLCVLVSFVVELIKFKPSWECLWYWFIIYTIVSLNPWEEGTDYGFVGL